jgi:hypothetical protein
MSRIEAQSTDATSYDPNHPKYWDCAKLDSWIRNRDYGSVHKWDTDRHHRDGLEVEPPAIELRFARVLAASAPFPLRSDWLIRRIRVAARVRAMLMRIWREPCSGSTQVVI